LICSLSKLPADARKRSVTRLIVSKRFSADPAFIAVSTSSTIEDAAFSIAHPERSGVLFWPTSIDSRNT
jgi:hypothetical protein